MPLVGDRLRAQRERTVLEHIDAENRCDYEAALATFERPRYEFVATDEVYEGGEQVMEHWLEFDRAFPDQNDEVLAIHHADETVLVEAVSRGTHLGPLRGLPPTGRSFELQFACIFVFEADRLVCERVYFDPNTSL